MTVCAGPHRGSFGSPVRPCAFPQVAMMDACCHSNCPCGLSVYSESDLTEMLASIHIIQRPRAWRGQTGCQWRTRRYTPQSFWQESQCSTSTSTCVTLWSKPRNPPPLLPPNPSPLQPTALSLGGQLGTLSLPRNLSNLLLSSIS